MKLAEAVLERDHLEHRLGVLESRLAALNDSGGPVRHIVEQIQHTANRFRDLSIAITWTETVNNLSGLPLTAHRIKIDTLQRLAAVFENTDQERADELYQAAHESEKVLAASTWLIDLKVPEGNQESQS